MARKRKPGGGRKPIGAVAKSATFTTRLEPPTRRALGQLAVAKGLSVSVMAENLLKAGLKKPTGAARNQALACAIALLAENIERATKKSWLEDEFTGSAFISAVEAFLFEFASIPADLPAVPSAVEEAGAKMPPKLADQWRKPEYLGPWLARFLSKEITDASSSGPFNEWTMPIFFSNTRENLGLIGRDLGLSAKGKRR
jgi:hypothetical protein